MNRTILFDATNQNPASICTEKIIHHRVFCHNKGEASSSLKMSYVGLQQNRDSPTVPPTVVAMVEGKTASVSRLVCYRLNRSEL